jgi:hypothetical protein
MSERAMRKSDGRIPAAIGFTVKSGWASVVLLTGPAASPRVVNSCRVELSDPAIAGSRQPYHAGFGTARHAGPDLSQLVAGVKRFGRKSVSEVIRQYQSGEHLVHGAGVVVGSLIDPTSIANDHIRTHALEGQLFRGVVQDAASRTNVPCSVWRERDLYASAADVLERPEHTLRAELKAMGAELAGSWRAEQKLAALAAWLIVARGPW